MNIRNTKKRKLTKPVSLDEAIKRIDCIFDSLKREVAIAILYKSTLEAGNQIIIEKYSGVQFEGAECYNTIRHSLQVYLILSLSKIFEKRHVRGRPSKEKRVRPSKAKAFNKSDLASIPIFLHLINQKRCRRKLIERAHAGWDDPKLKDSGPWARDCRESLRRFDEATRRLATPEARRAARILQTFRDNQVAHLYIKPRRWASNRYNELFFLLDIAADLVCHAAIAIKGLNINFKEIETLRFESARTFWQPALEAAAIFDSSAMNNSSS